MTTLRFSPRNSAFRPLSTTEIAAMGEISKHAIAKLLMPAPTLSEYHTGFRAFSKEVLQTLPLLENSDDFVFDNQMLAQSVMFGFRIGEISCPTSYFEEASSINFRRNRKISAVRQDWKKSGAEVLFGNRAQSLITGPGRNL
jgi:hypothetical protein